MLMSDDGKSNFAEDGKLDAQVKAAAMASLPRCPNTRELTCILQNEDLQQEVIEVGA